jgi:hypothetical protein
MRPSPATTTIQSVADIWALLLEWVGDTPRRYSNIPPPPISTLVGVVAGERRERGFERRAYGNGRICFTPDPVLRRAGAQLLSVHTVTVFHAPAERSLRLHAAIRPFPFDP